LDEGLGELKDLKQLRSLALGKGITDKGLGRLKEFQGLEEVNLTSTQVTVTGLKELKEIKSLKSLILAENATDEWLKQLKILAKLKGLTQLPTTLIQSTSLTF
jgi:putative SOS response-associated peptidase YedK